MDLHFEQPNIRTAPQPFEKEARYEYLRKEPAQLEREQVDRLLARLRKVANSRKLMRNFARGCAWVGVSNLVVVLMTYVIMSLATHHPATIDIDLLRVATLVEMHGTTLTLGGGWILLSAFFLGASIAARLRARKQGEATRYLSEFTDLRAVGPLAEALNLGDDDLRATAESALIPLLNRLGAYDGHLLTAEQRACLHGAIRYDNTAFGLAVLKALEQVGDELDLKFVNSLVANEARNRGVAAINATLGEAAKDASQAMQQRIAAHNAHATLLRPARREDVDVLLRPVSATVSDPDRLLRASSPNSPHER